MRQKIDAKQTRQSVAHVVDILSKMDLIAAFAFKIPESERKVNDVAYLAYLAIREDDTRSAKLLCYKLADKLDRDLKKRRKNLKGDSVRIAELALLEFQRQKPVPRTHAAKHIGISRDTFYRHNYAEEIHFLSLWITHYFIDAMRAKGRLLE